MNRRMYETVFIINAALEDAAIDSIFNATVDVITNNGGTIDTQDKWGRRHLAYPIQKKHNGFYAYVMFEAAPTLLPQLKRFFQLEENIMRHLVVKMTPQGLEFRKNFLQNRTERMVSLDSLPHNNKNAAKAEQPAPAAEPAAAV